MAKKTIRQCSFCGRTAEMCEALVPSPDNRSFVCSECIDLFHEMLVEYRTGVPSGKNQDKKSFDEGIQLAKVPKPKEIMDFLNAIRSVNHAKH